MAHVVRFHQVCGPEVLRVEEVEVSHPGRGEVQIRVKALGLNRAESMFRRGQYLEQPRLPDARKRVNQLHGDAAGEAD
jgi:NADPH:quinone reductase-like Zn-dependent oxidoreductase